MTGFSILFSLVVAVFVGVAAKYFIEQAIKRRQERARRYAAAASRSKRTKETRVALQGSSVPVVEKRPSVPASAPPGIEITLEPSIDQVRLQLQKVSYEMVGTRHSAEAKARFKQDMTEFAAADPLVQEITRRAQQIVAQNPGMLQSSIYTHFPDADKEQVRYALYFAHELGWIFRKKKGRSYQLFPPGETYDQ